MAQNKDLKTKVQLQREYNTLLSKQKDMEEKLLRYQKEGIELTGEEKRAYIDLKKQVDDAGKSYKEHDGRTKNAKKASEQFARSLETKLGKALKGVDKQTQKLYDGSADAFGGLADEAKKYSNSTKKGADRATELIETIVDLQAEVIQAGAGFRNLSDDQAEALNEKIKELEKSAEDVFQGAFKEGGDRAKEIFEGMKDTAKAGKTLGQRAQELADKFDISLTKADLLASAAAAVAAAVESAAEQAQKFQDSLGVSNKLARQQIFNFRNIGLSFIGLNDDIGDANIQLGLASNNLDVATGRSKNLSQNIAFISRDTGASAQSLATVNELFQNTAGLTAEQASQLQLGLVSMSEMAGVIPGQVLEDMATNAEMLSKFSDGTAEGMARAAIQAQKLGINLSKAGQIADSLLNLESSIASEFEASVLIGRELNFDRARNLALNNDIEGAMKDIVDQLGSEEEFNRLNAIQRQALADSIGVGVEDLAAMVRRGGEGAAEVDMGVKLQKQANKTLKDIFFQISAGLVGKITAGIASVAGTIIGVRGLKKFLGNSSLLGKTFTRMSGLFSKFLPFLGKISMFLAPLIDIARFIFGGSDEKKSAGTSIGLGAVGAGIGTIFGGPIGAAIGYGIGSLVGLLTTKIFPQVGAAVARGLTAAFEGAKKFLAGAGDFMSNTAGEMGQKVTEIKAKISGFFTNVKDATMTGANNLKAKAGDILVTVTESFTKVKDTVIEGITNVFSKMIAAAKEQINKLTGFLGFKLFDEEETDVSGGVSQDFIMRPGQGIQRFSGGDTVAGVKDPAMFASLAGNRGVSESGTKQVALLQALVNNSNAQMAEIIRTNKEITAAVNNIGRSSGA